MKTDQDKDCYFLSEYKSNFEVRFYNKGQLIKSKEGMPLSCTLNNAQLLKMIDV